MIGSDIPHEQNPSKQIEQQEVVLRLLAFGQESVDMLQSIHSVFEDTIQRAENWLGKLRMINPISSNSSNNTQKSSNDEDFCSILLPPIRDLHLSPASAVLE
jgi:hypothetical protein